MGQNRPQTLICRALLGVWLTLTVAPAEAASTWEPPWHDVMWGVDLKTAAKDFPAARKIQPPRRIGPLIEVWALPMERPAGVRFFTTAQADAATGTLRQMVMTHDGSIEPFELKNLLKTLVARWGGNDRTCHRWGIDSGDGEHWDYIWTGPQTTVHLTLYDLVTRRQIIGTPVQGAPLTVATWRLPRLVILRAHATGDAALIIDEGCQPGGGRGPGFD